MANAPSKSVATTALPDFTYAPIKGSPLNASSTVPVTVQSWAPALKVIAQKSNAQVHDLVI
jgi:hypothetical protein